MRFSVSSHFFPLPCTHLIKTAAYMYPVGHLICRDCLAANVKQITQGDCYFVKVMNGFKYLAFAGHVLVYDKRITFAGSERVAPIKPRVRLPNLPPFVAETELDILDTLYLPGPAEMPAPSQQQKPRRKKIGHKKIGHRPTLSTVETASFFPQF